MSRRLAALALVAALAGCMPARWAPAPHSSGRAPTAAAVCAATTPTGIVLEAAERRGRVDHCTSRWLCWTVERFTGKVTFVVCDRELPQ